MIVLTSITICLAVLGIISYHTENDILLVVSIISLLVFGLVGWGIFATSSTEHTSEEKAIVTDIIRGRHILVVSTICSEVKDDNNVVFKNNEIDYINNNTYFYWLVSYNYYGVEISRTLKFRNK